MTHVAVFFVSLAMLTAPTWGARKQADINELAPKQLAALRAAQPPFFWRKKGTGCFNSVPKDKSCPEEHLAKEIDDFADCETATAALLSEGSSTPYGDVGTNTVSKYTVEFVEKNRLSSIGSKRGCFVRNTDTAANFVTFVPTERDEYYGSDICGCYPKQGEEKVFSAAQLESELKAKIEELGAAMKLEERAQGAEVKVQGAKAVVVGEQDNQVVVLKEGHDEVENVELDVIEIEEPDTAQQVDLLIKQISRTCACYHKDLRTQCCIFGQAPGVELKYHKKDTDHFKGGNVELKPHSCKADEFASVNTPCVTECMDKPAPEDRSECKVPCGCDPGPCKGQEEGQMCDIPADKP